MAGGQGRPRPALSQYQVEVARRAVKALAALPRKEQQRVRAAIDLLADNPRPPGCVAMADEDRAYRVRVGDYRIVYEVFDDRLVVQVISHRRDARDQVADTCLRGAKPSASVVAARASVRRRSSIPAGQVHIAHTGSGTRSP